MSREERIAWLKTLKPGDKVTVQKRWGFYTTYDQTIKKITPTKKIRLEDGELYNSYGVRFERGWGYKEIFEAKAGQEAAKEGKAMSDRPIQHQLLDLQYQLDSSEGILDDMDDYLSKQAQILGHEGQHQAMYAIEHALDKLRVLRGEKKGASQEQT